MTRLIEADRILDYNIRESYDWYPVDYENQKLYYRANDSEESYYLSLKELPGTLVGYTNEIVYKVYSMGDHLTNWALMSGARQICPISDNEWLSILNTEDTPFSQEYLEDRISHEAIRFDINWLSEMNQSQIATAEYVTSKKLSNRIIKEAQFEASKIDELAISKTLEYLRADSKFSDLLQFNITIKFSRALYSDPKFDRDTLGNSNLFKNNWNEDTLGILIKSENNIAKLFMHDIMDGTAHLTFSVTEFGNSIEMIVPTEDASELFLSWVNGDYAKVLLHHCSPEKWAIELGEDAEYIAPIIIISGLSNNFIYAKNASGYVYHEIDLYDDETISIETSDGWEYDMQYNGSYWEFQITNTGTDPEPILKKSSELTEDENKPRSDELIIVKSATLFVGNETYKCGKID